MTAEGHFQPAIYAPVSTYRDIQEVACGLSRAESAALLNYVGSNAIPYMPDTIMASIAIEFLTPFYLYQLLVYMLWIWFGWVA